MASLIAEKIPAMAFFLTLLEFALTATKVTAGLRLQHPKTIES